MILIGRRAPFIGCPLALVAALGAAIALPALMPMPATAQSLSVSPRVSLMDGDATALSAGVRVEVGSANLAFYGQGGVFRRTSTCLTSDPPFCSSPSSGGLELLGGARLSLPRLGVAHPAISFGVGALVWDDLWGYKSGVGNIWEAELQVGVRALSWSDLVLGVTLKNIGQSVSGGMRLGRDRGTYAGIVMGLRVPVTGR